MKKKIIITVSLCMFVPIIGWACMYTYVSTHNTYVTKGLIGGKAINELILDSDIVIRGNVNNILDSKWSNPEKVPNKRNIITTDILININEIYKGTPYDSKNVAVRIGKGSTRFLMQ